MTCPLQTEETDLLLDYSAGRLGDRGMDAGERTSLRNWRNTWRPVRTARLSARSKQAVWDALDLWEPAPVSLDFNRRLWQRIDSSCRGSVV